MLSEMHKSDTYPQWSALEIESSQRRIWPRLVVVVQDMITAGGELDDVTTTAGGEVDYVTIARDVLGDFSITTGASHARINAINTAFFSFLRGEYKVALVTPHLNLLLNLRVADAAQ
jgi:hypothetical protein